MITKFLQFESHIKEFYSAESIHAWLDPKKRPSMRKRFLEPYYGYNEVETVVGHGDFCSGHYIDWLEEKAPKYADSIRQSITKIFKTPWQVFLLYCMSITIVC